MALTYQKHPEGLENQSPESTEQSPENSAGRDGEQIAAQPTETEQVRTEPVETEPVETEPMETERIEAVSAETVPVETTPVETVPNITLSTEPTPTNTVESTRLAETVDLPPADRSSDSPPVTWLLVIVLLALIAALIVPRLRRTKTPEHKEQLRKEKLPPGGKIAVGKVQAQGAREYQQDTFGVSDARILKTHGLLAVVADGMGGLKDSGQVSVKVVETVLDAFALSQGAGQPKELLMTLAKAAVSEVNDMLGPERLRTSGTTMVMGLIRSGQLFFLSIGDSRICLFREGKLLQLNREHDYENELALRAINGEFSVQEALSNPKKTALTSFVGMGEIRSVDMPAEPIRLYPGDKVILMSDGVYNALNSRELSRALQKTAETAAEEIKAAIEEKHFSNQDNYTAVILGV